MFPSTLEFLPDIPYGKQIERAHLLDILKPKNITKPVPAILFLHGGGWRMYGKYPQINILLAEAGYITASSNYRYSSEAVFPAQLEDALFTVAWMRSQSSNFGINPARIGVWRYPRTLSQSEQLHEVLLESGIFSRLEVIP